MTDPKVTVLIPAFNAERYIADAIESILAQTLTDFELLLIDDGSHDATPAIMSRYRSDPRVHVIRHKQNQGRPRTRNEGLRLARGQYIAFLDADDRCVADRLHQQVSYLDSQQHIAVLGSWRHKIDAKGRILPTDRRREPTTPDDIAGHLLFRCPIHQPTIMARTRVLAAYRYDVSFPVSQDYDLWVRLAERHKFATLPKRLTFYRRHADQATTSEKPLIQHHGQRIHARQLKALGVAFDDQDLQYHRLLPGGRHSFRAKIGHDMDLAYIRWARWWLNELVSANAARQCYPEQAFARIVGCLWWSLCRKATRDAGINVWREFGQSTLMHAAFKAWLYEARTRTDDEASE